MVQAREVFDFLLELDVPGRICARLVKHHSSRPFSVLGSALWNSSGRRGLGRLVEVKAHLGGIMGEPKIVA